MFYDSSALTSFQISQIQTGGFCFDLYTADSALLSNQLVAVGASISEITNAPSTCPNALATFYAQIAGDVSALILSIFSFCKFLLLC